MVCGSAYGIEATAVAHTRVVVHSFVFLQYDEYKSPMDNIGMQDSLLSRFDMIFIVLDEMDPDHDRRISEHVLRMHRYRNPGEQVWMDATHAGLTSVIVLHHH